MIYKCVETNYRNNDITAKISQSVSNLCTVYVVSKGVYILSGEKLASSPSDTERNEILRDTGSERSSSSSSGGSGTISGQKLFK